MENGKWRMERQHLAGNGPAGKPALRFHSFVVLWEIQKYPGRIILLPLYNDTRNQNYLLCATRGHHAVHIGRFGRIQREIVGSSPYLLPSRGFSPVFCEKKTR
jgi:hypothetical protein